MPVHVPAPWFDADLRRLRPERPPVLLLGGLNLLRPLGFASIPAIVASSDAGAPVFWSRYCRGRCLLPPVENRDAALAALLEAGDRLASAFGRAVPLFYGNDDWLDLILEHRERLAPRFRLVLNDPDVARALIDKDRFAQFARKRALAVPATLAWEGDGPGTLAGCSAPVLVKPKTKIAWEQSSALLRLFGGEECKARVFANGRDILSHAQAQQLSSELVFQEYIPGDDRCIWSFHGYADEESRLLASFIGRKLRTYPALTGSSSYLELAHDEKLAKIGRHFVHRARLKGPFKIDFKRDPRTGRFYALEINARFNLWHHLGARNGVNLPAIAYEYLLHGVRPAVPPAHRTRIRWLNLPLDVRAYRQLSSRGELSLAKWLLSLAVRPKVYDLFSWTDPLPLASLLRRRAMNRLGRGLLNLKRRLRGWLSTAS